MKRILILSLLLISASAQAALDWKPTRTFVFVVGILEWADSETFTPFPKENRRDLQLVNLFRKAGVPAQNLVYLQDKKGTLKNINQSFAALMQKTQPGDLLIVYFCGHGFLDENDSSKLVLANYDSGIGKVYGWVADDIVTDIEKKFRGSRALLMSDSCHSGGLGDAVKRQGSRVSYACLGASTTAEESTENWTYTEAVLDGLQGNAAADYDNDGWVTFAELRRFISAELKFGEGQQASSYATGDWKKRTVLARTSATKDPRIGANVEVLSEGDYYKARIVDVRDGEFCVFYYGYEETDNEWVTSDRIIWKKGPARAGVAVANTEEK